jgi:His-Xaa-Ser system radical SAM maturase HxsC
MKVIKSSPVNISRIVMGKITKEPLARFKRKDSIFATSDLNSRFTGYTGVVTDKHCPDSLPKKLTNTPLCHSVAELDYLNDGDIVSLDEKGNICVLYKNGSFDNAILVTEECNTNCIMCPQPRKKEEESKTPFNLKLISLMDKSTSLLGITGGEPTIKGDELLEIINACKKYIPKAQIDILSNGIRFSDFEYVKKIVLLQHPKLLFAVSLYADTDNEHNLIVQAKGFYKTIQGLYNLALFNQKIEIRVVIHKLNYKRLLNLAEFIYNNFPFVYHIAFMGMETIGLAQKNIEQVWIDPYDYMPQLKDAVIYLEQRNMNVSVYNLQLCILPEVLWPSTVKSISSWKNIYLDVCGKCESRNSCGGLFSSSKDKHSAYIRPLNKENLT